MENKNKMKPLGFETREEVERYIVAHLSEENMGIPIYCDPDYASAFCGIKNGRAVYDYDAMVEHLMMEYISEGESVEEAEAMALDFIDYNTLGAHFSDHDPIVQFNYDDEELCCEEIVF